MKIVTVLLLAVAGSGIVACGASASRIGEQAETSAVVAVETLYSSSHCGGPEAAAKVRWISSVTQLERIYKGFHRSTVGADPMVSPEIDFNRAGVALVEMGQHPTLGYRMVLAESVARVVQNRVEIVLEWVKPGRDMMVGQMVTSPCLLLKLERGQYQEVWVKDELGQHKVSTVLPDVLPSP